MRGIFLIVMVGSGNTMHFQVRKNVHARVRNIQGVKFSNDCEKRIMNCKI